METNNRLYVATSYVSCVLRRIEYITCLVGQLQLKPSCVQVPQNRKCECDQETAISPHSAVEEAPIAFEAVAAYDARPMECMTILCVKSVLSAVIIAGI